MCLQTDVLECGSEPCHNSGVCVENEGAPHQCLCLTGTPQPPLSDFLLSINYILKTDI